MMTIDELADCPIISSWRQDAAYGPCNMLCSELNSSLLNPSNAKSDKLLTLIKEFDALFVHNQLPAQTKLFRSCPRWTVKKLIEDGTMVYPAFMSTSTCAASAKIFFNHIPTDDLPYFLNLHLNAIIPTIDAQSRRYKGVSEKEFILPRNLTLKCLRVLSDSECEASITT